MRQVFQFTCFTSVLLYYSARLQYSREMRLRRALLCGCDRVFSLLALLVLLYYSARLEYSREIRARVYARRSVRMRQVFSLLALLVQKCKY